MTTALPHTIEQILPLDVINASTLGMEALDSLRPLIFSIEQLYANPTTPQGCIAGLCQVAIWLIDDYYQNLDQMRIAVGTD